MTLAGKVALVTGGSRGVGRGVARALGEAGATVWLTGRTSDPGPDPRPGTIEHVAREVDAAGGRGIAVRCDHGVDAEIEALFARVAAESGRLDVLVNNVHSGLEYMAETVEHRFWEIGTDHWDRMNHVGLRGHYLASVHAARMMVPRKSGLIVNISSYGAVSYLFSTCYGVGKCALDRMTRDTAKELAGEGVTVVSVYPGFVKTEFTTEMITRARPLYRRIYAAYAENPIVTGRAVAGLAADARVARLSGRSLIAAEVARRYRLRDEDGTVPWSPRSLRTMARAFAPGASRGWARLAPPVLFPEWVVRQILTRFTDYLKASGGYRGAGG